MSAKLKVEATVHFGRESRSEKVVRAGEAPPEPPGRVPRISRMMALAIWFDELIRRGNVENFSELARFGQVSRTQVNQADDNSHGHEQSGSSPDRSNRSVHTADSCLKPIEPQLRRFS